MSNLEKWIKAILNEDGNNLSIGSVRTLQLIKHEMERLQKENAILEQRIIDQDKQILELLKINKETDRPF